MSVNLELSITQVDIDVEIQSQYDVDIDFMFQENIDIGFIRTETVDIEVTPTESIELNIDYLGSGAITPPYLGDYDPIPTIEGLTLHTVGKRMIRNVDVQPIPISRVPAPDDKGYVVTIG